MARILALFGLLMSLLPTMAYAAPGTMKVRASKYPVTETADRLAKAIEAKGIKIAARFDHAAGAKTAGLELPPTVVLVFGNPKLGTPLMVADPRIGIDLPMRMLVWQDKAGKVWIGYTPPSTLQARYGIEGNGPVATLKKMAAALDAFAKTAADGP